MIQRVFTSSLLLLLAAHLKGQNDTPQAIVDRASTLFSPAAHASDSLHLETARCVGALLPDQPSSKDGEYEGVVSCRVGQNWSPPALVSGELLHDRETTSGSQPLIFATGTQAATENLLRGEFRLDSGGFRLAGPEWQEMKSAGGGNTALPDLVIRKDDEENRVLYGSDASYSSILGGRVESPASERAFSNDISREQARGNRYGMGAGAAPESPRTGGKPDIGLDSVPSDTSAGASRTKRLTGYAFLLRGQAEESGYGLYSYILLDHHPSAEEHDRFVALLVAVLARPTVGSLQSYVSRQHINVTEIPLEVDRPEEIARAQTPEKMAGWILDNYDYGRATAILGSLPQRAGPGPVIISVLHPANPEESPRPVFFQDLSHAQPKVMATYVGQFVQQAGKERFWDEPALAAFSVGLSNFLETAANGLGLSADGVKPWLKMIK